MSIQTSVQYTYNALTAVGALMTDIDFTLSNTRRFYSSMGNPLAVKGLKEQQKEAFLYKKENSAFSGLACQSSHGTGSNNCKPFTNNRGYQQRLGLECCKWHNTSANAPLNRDEGGLLSETFLHLITIQLVTKGMKGVAQQLYIATY